MEIYLVGGYVRDHFLRKEFHYDIPEGDRDWVVVGTTPQEMLEKGFLPVGKDFPVFLHPKTHEEYALARTERKVAPGYHGFTFHASPDVTLGEDLHRRDLTINAMAMQGETLYDPYNGLADLKSKTLRHVSDAFKEDPVRILRVARFCAKLEDFSVADETLNLMKTMVESGEADALVPERVFLEMRKAFSHRRCDQFINVLMACDLGQKLFSDLNLTKDILEKLTQAHDSDLRESEKFAILTANAVSIEVINNFFKKLKPSSEIMDLCRLWHRMKSEFIVSPEGLLSVMEKSDAFRRPQRYEQLINVASLMLGINASIWHQAKEVASSVNTAEIAQNTTDKKDIPNRIHEARLLAIKDSL